MNFIRQNQRLFITLLLSLTIGVLLMSSCVNTDTSHPTNTGNLEEARAFLNDAEKQLLDLNIKYARADWIKSTFITDDTEALSAQTNTDVIAATTELAEVVQDDIHINVKAARRDGRAPHHPTSIELGLRAAELWVSSTTMWTRHPASSGARIRLLVIVRWSSI